MKKYLTLIAFLGVITFVYASYPALAEDDMMPNNDMNANTQVTPESDTNYEESDCVKENGEEDCYVKEGTADNEETAAPEHDSEEE